MKKIPGSILFLLWCMAAWGAQSVPDTLPKTLQEQIAHLRADQILDPKDSLPERAISWERYRGAAIGVLLFFGGFAAGRLWLRVRHKRGVPPPPDTSLLARIEATEDPKALLGLLIVHRSSRVEPYIERLEALLYGDATEEFTTLKEELIGEYRDGA